VDTYIQDLLLQKKDKGSVACAVKRPLVSSDYDSDCATDTEKAPASIPEPAAKKRKVNRRSKKRLSLQPVATREDETPTVVVKSEFDVSLVLDLVQRYQTLNAAQRQQFMATIQVFKL
jgi:hypothetical protein